MTTSIVVPVADVDKVREDQARAYAKRHGLPYPWGNGTRYLTGYVVSKDGTQAAINVEACNLLTEKDETQTVTTYTLLGKTTTVDATTDGKPSKSVTLSATTTGVDVKTWSADSTADAGGTVTKK